jgi:hypothetical protein
VPEIVPEPGARVSNGAQRETITAPAWEEIGRDRDATAKQSKRMAQEAKRLGVPLAKPTLTEKQGAPLPREPLAIVDLHDFLRMSIPPREMLLDPVILSQWLGLLHGWRGEGKTYLALAIAYAVASGGSVLGWKAPKPAKVLYVDGEMLSPVLQQRLSAITAGADREPEKAMLQLLTPDLQTRPMPDLSTVGGLAALEECMPLDTRLIIVDSLSSLVWGEGNENESESWLSVAQWAIAQRVAGRSVLFIHHSGKAGTQRGTSRREDFLDTVLRLKSIPGHSPKAGAKFEIRVEKARSRSNFEEVEAELVPSNEGEGVQWVYRTIETSVRDRVFELADCGMKRPEISKELGISRATVYRYLAQRP